MGVMECSRKNCENIMCDTYSKVTGYICNECKSELEESNPSSTDEVRLFMLTNKKEIWEKDNNFSLSIMFGEENE